MPLALCGSRTYATSHWRSQQAPTSSEHAQIVSWVPYSCRTDTTGPIRLSQLDLWHWHALPADLLCRRDDLRSARDDDLAILVDDVALEGDTPLGPVPVNRTYRHGDGIAQTDGPLKVEGLTNVDGAGSGQFGPQHGRDQGTAPHPVRDDLVKHVALGELFVDMRRVDVARHGRKQLDIAPCQRPRKSGLITDRNLVEGAVLDARIFSHGLTPMRVLWTGDRRKRFREPADMGPRFVARAWGLMGVPREYSRGQATGCEPSEV